MLAVLETHPVQYHAPVYRALGSRFGIPVTAIYGSDFSVVGYRDREFGTTFAWDTDLLSGYHAVFLSRSGSGGAKSPERVGVRGMGQALAAAAPSAVLLTGYSPRFHQLAFYSAWRTGVPTLFRGETTDHARDRSRAKAWIRDRALRWLYGRCAALLYVGQRSHQHLRRLAPAAGRLVFSPYCVDASTFECDEAARERLRAGTRQSLEATEQEIVLLFSGKLVRRKGPEMVAHAVAGLPAGVRERVALVFLGDGELRPALEVLARRLGLHKVCFLGFRNQTELSRYYHAANLVVLPSVQSETWGLVVNEALHHGVPCVVSNAVGCAPDLVEPGVTGEVSETGSTPSLTAALLRALAMVNRHDIRDACRARVADYSVERAARGIAEAYDAVARTGRRTSTVE
jgi:glycosyltransferase involved in cell wall biosynthesis